MNIKLLITMAFSVLTSVATAANLNNAAGFTLSSWGPKEPVSYGPNTALLLDPDYASPQVFKQAKRKNTPVVCYMSVGTYEPFRKSSKAVPTAALGNKVNGWNERWIIPSKWKMVAPFVQDRLDHFKALGCDAVESDNTDCYTYPNCPDKNSKPHIIRYIHWLSHEIRSRGMLFGLKNTLELIRAVDKSVDFYINEECVQYNECNLYPKNSKKRFHVEYNTRRSRACTMDTGNNLWLTKYRVNGKWNDCF